MQRGLVCWQNLQQQTPHNYLLVIISEMVLSLNKLVKKFTNIIGSVMIKRWWHCQSLLLYTYSSISVFFLDKMYILIFISNLF